MGDDVRLMIGIGAADASRADPSTPNRRRSSAVSRRALAPPGVMCGVNRTANWSAGGLDEHPRPPAESERGHPRSVGDSRTLVGTTRPAVAGSAGSFRVAGRLPVGRYDRAGRSAAPRLGTSPNEVRAGGRTADLSVPAAGNPAAQRGTNAPRAAGPQPAIRHLGIFSGLTPWPPGPLGDAHPWACLVRHPARSSLTAPVVQPAPDVSSLPTARLQRFRGSAAMFDATPLKSIGNVIRFGVHLTWTVTGSPDPGATGPASAYNVLPVGWRSGRVGIGDLNKDSNGHGEFGTRGGEGGGSRRRRDRRAVLPRGSRHAKQGDRQ